MTSAHGDPPLLRILGTVSVAGPDHDRPVGGRLDRLLLVRLALAHGGAVSVDTLTDALWPHDPPPGSRNALQVKVSRLRRLLGNHAARLTYAHGAYRLAVSEAETDLGCYLRAVRGAEEQLSHDRTQARDQLRIATDLWPGDPLAEFAEDRVVEAERLRLAELHAVAEETQAELDLEAPTTRPAAIASLRALLAADPMRARARELLMHGLDLTGRRSDALAVYDAGRRLYLQHSGLEPPERLTACFDRLLAAERAATRRASALQRERRQAPEGLLDAARWLAEDDDLAGGMQLALRGVWWWWIGARRSQARELLDDLLERTAESGSDTPAMALAARAWLAVLDSHSTQAALRIADGHAALTSVDRPAWTQHDALAAVLIAERLFDRGEPARAQRLLQLARRHYGLAEDDWGVALCGIVATRGRLLSGDVQEAYVAAQSSLEMFLGLDDEAGQVISLDVMGYCAEVLGDLAAADTAHRRALGLARRVGSPEWEATQLTRLGNVGTLRGDRTAERTLQGAASLSSEIGSAAITALCHNGRGLALHLAGERQGAAEEHDEALRYYRAAGSEAGLAYTEARLALVADDAVAASQPLAHSALQRAVHTRDPRAIAHSLEAFALTTEDPARGATALGAAAALRLRSNAPLPDRLRLPLLTGRDVFERRLGSRFDELVRAGQRDPIGTARTV